MEIRWNLPISLTQIKKSHELVWEPGLLGVGCGEERDEKNAIATINRAFDLGINLIDTAPAYGFGLSEEIVGKALKLYGKREQIVIATKVGTELEKSSSLSRCEERGCDQRDRGIS